MIYSIDDVWGVLSPQEALSRMWSVYGGNVPTPVAPSDDDPVVQAEVSLRQWIAHCPNCPSATAVSKTHGLFYCLNCLNQENGGRWLVVSWPDDEELVEREVDLSPTESWSP